MSTYKELNNYYKEHFNKDFSRATLTRWVNENKIKAKKQDNGRYDYDLTDFIQVVNSEAYQLKSQASKENPKDYIGRTKGHLLIKRLVPKQEYNSKYSGTLMYCDCLACGKKDVQVRFTYLSDNGNYDQLTCGCGRKIRAFLASARNGINEDYLYSFDNFEKFLYVHKMLIHITDNYYGVQCNLNEYKNALETIYYDKQFNAIYDFWKNKNFTINTFYDMAKPSIDHIIPLSRGGTSKIDNLQILTVFENLAKRDMTMLEWNNFKYSTNTHSNYFIDEILKGGDVNE